MNFSVGFSFEVASKAIRGLFVLSLMLGFDWFGLILMFFSIFLIFVESLFGEEEEATHLRQGEKQGEGG